MISMSTYITHPFFKVYMSTFITHIVSVSHFYQYHPSTLTGTLPINVYLYHLRSFSPNACLPISPKGPYIALFYVYYTFVFLIKFLVLSLHVYLYHLGNPALPRLLISYTFVCLFVFCL